jgi:hypothetical protein
MTAIIRNALRGWLPWLQFQELRREGCLAAWRRARLHGSILQTPPVRTSGTGQVEVRVLTWRRDWINLIWALKTFYHYAKVDYPLVVHDGGLLPWQSTALLNHFPDAYFIPATAAEARYPAELRRRGLNRSAAYRARNVSTRKLFDFYLDSKADFIITIDSDIVFFRRPDELILQHGGWTRNWYNLDNECWYSLSLDELETAFGVRPPPCVNSGLAVVHRESIDFQAIERYLEHPKLFADRWVSEQTLHALVSTSYGLAFLPESYRVGGPPGVEPDLVCKHYPGAFRPLLYTEAMRRLVDNGLIDGLKSAQVIA